MHYIYLKKVVTVHRQIGNMHKTKLLTIFEESERFIYASVTAVAFTLLKIGKS